MFYIIEVDENQYDVFNVATDGKILEAVPKEKVTNFLEFNCPSHSFLVNTNKDAAAEYYSDYFGYVSDEDISKYQFSKIDLSKWPTQDEGPTEMDDYDYFSDCKYEFNYDNYTDTAEHDNLFSYDDPNDYFAIDEDGLRRENSSGTQLEFEFTYRDKEDKEVCSPLPPTNDEEEEIPMLPEDEE